MDMIFGTKNGDPHNLSLKLIGNRLVKDFHPVNIQLKIWDSS